MICPKCSQPSNKHYSSKEATYILNNEDSWSWWFDFGSTEYGFFTIDHIPGNYPSLEVGSCFKDKEEGHKRLAEMTEEEGWEFTKGGERFAAARGQAPEVGGQKSETGLSIRERIKQAAINAIGEETEIIDEDRPFMDVPDIAEEITRSVMGIIKDDTVKEVVIGVRGGVAEPVSVPEGVSVKIRDYDIDGCEDDDLAQDEGGGQCVESYYQVKGLPYYVGDEDDGDPC